MSEPRGTDDRNCDGSPSHSGHANRLNGGSSLATRTASALVLATLAIAATLVGGWVFVSFWAAAAVGIFWEWVSLTSVSSVGVLAVGSAALLGSAAAASSGYFPAALVVLAAGALAVGLGCSPRARGFAIGGLLYAGTLVLGPVMLHRDPVLGGSTILFLFAVVWATDIFGYFAGRRLGGPKLAPSISPNKTWAGACGGIIGAIAAGGLTARTMGSASLLASTGVALALSVVSQAGDLFESAVKRRFGVKDAGYVIPGHGGLMDRLDGFLAAAGVAALIGIARGGTEASARGLLWW